MSRSFPYVQVDAFASQPLAGNPCAIIYDADALHPDEMLAIAREMNFSETAFILKSDKADFRFRYFTPAEEIPLAGHPTLATVYSLVEKGIIAKGVSKVSVELEAGVIDVFIREAGGAPVIAMTQIPPVFLRVYDPRDILPLFSLEADDLLGAYPLQTVSTGAPVLMVPLCNKQALEKIVLKPDAFAAFRATSDFFCVHLFCMEGFTPQGQIAARNFAPPPDAVEDPYTGSSMGAMGCYLWKRGLIQTPSFVAEQGHLMQRPGIGWIDLQIEQNEIKGVTVGGSARTVITGILTLPDRGVLSFQNKGLDSVVP